jgi:hypothetical protein
MFHDTKVLKLKCRTYEPVKYIGWVSQVIKTIIYITYKYIYSSFTS